MKGLRHLLGAHTAATLEALSPARLRRDEGQTLVEYALILFFIAIVVIVALTFLSGQIQSVFSQIGSAI